jgi:hypothetical protein
MPTQPEPSLPFDAPPPRPSVRALSGLIASRSLYWAPVWVPMIVLAQVALGGLRPALAESRRLEREEVRMGERLEREKLEAAQLGAALRAQNDPIYLERERRLQRNSDGPRESK